MRLIKKPVKDRWVKALRSGKYKKNVGALRSVNSKDDKFCCLGVLCDLVKKDGWRGLSLYDTSHLGEQSFPNASIIRLIKLQKADEIEINDIFLRMATEMNDHGKSFYEIADYIEKNL